MRRHNIDKMVGSLSTCIRGSAYIVLEKQADMWLLRRVKNVRHTSQGPANRRNFNFLLE